MMPLLQATLAQLEAQASPAPQGSLAQQVMLISHFYQQRIFGMVCAADCA
jgi:hypothetical protein